MRVPSLLVLLAGLSTAAPAPAQTPSLTRLSRIVAAWSPGSPVLWAPPPPAAPPPPLLPPIGGSADELFVLTSVGGGADPVWWFDVVRGTAIWKANDVATDNVNGATLARGGAELVVSGGLAQPRIIRGDLSSVPPTWSTIYSPGGSGPFDVQSDEARQLLYVIAQPSPVGFTELLAVDNDPTSPTYEQVVASTQGLTSNAFTERFGLSASGRRAAVLSPLQRQLYVVDTDPASPTHMQVLHQGTVPTTGVFPIVTEAVVTPDDSMVLISVQAGAGGPSQVARFDLSTMSFIDHAAAVPGVQNIGPDSVPVAGLGAAAFDLDVASDGAFAVVCGWSGAGWAGRLDLDPSLPNGWSWTDYSVPSGFADAWALDLDSLDRLLAIETVDRVLLMNPREGTVLRSLPVGISSNVYTVRLR